MSNRIREMHVHSGRLNPAESEVWITVHPLELTSTTQVRGRLMGPRCRYSTTVEVAYPLREQNRFYETEDRPHLTMRVIMPEASFWDPESPFYYEGPVELWQGGECCDRKLVRQGLQAHTLGTRGLIWNGRALPIRGVACTRYSESDLVHWHQAGYNTLLLSAPDSEDSIKLAEEIGFLMLFRVTEREDFKKVTAHVDHFSVVGCVLSQELHQDPIVAAVLPVPSEIHLVPGMEFVATGAFPATVSCLLCPARVARQEPAMPLPTIVQAEGPLPADAKDEPLAPGVLGMIWQA
jgi:hypothetical protein